MTVRYLIRELDFGRHADEIARIIDESDRARPRQLEAAFASGDAFSFVAENRGIACAWVVVHTSYRADLGWLPDPDTLRFQSGENAYLEHLHVGSDHRRKRIAAFLCEAAENRAREIGKGKLWLHVGEDNPRALEFYRKTGWVYEYTVRPDWMPNRSMQVHSKEL